MLFVALSGWLMMWWLMNNATWTVLACLWKTIIYMGGRCCVGNFWAWPIVYWLLSPTTLSDWLINHWTRVRLHTVLWRLRLLSSWGFILWWTAFGRLTGTVLNRLRFRFESWFRSSYIVWCVLYVINILFKSIGNFVRMLPLVTWRIVIGALMILLLIQISILPFLTLGIACVVVMACWCCFWQVLMALIISCRLAITGGTGLFSISLAAVHWVANSCWGCNSAIAATLFNFSSCELLKISNTWL